MNGRGVALALVAGLGLASTLLAAACGGHSSAPGVADATKIATHVLGHAPTGLAKTIIARGTLEVADDANYAPQRYIDDSGKLVGFDVDVAKKTAAYLGLKIHIQNPQWDSVPTGLSAGRYDVSIGSMRVTAELQDTIDFTNPYYYTQSQCIVRQGSSPYTDVASMTGKKIGVVAQTTDYDFLTAAKGPVVKTYNDDADLFLDLKNGLIDGAVTSDLTLGQAAASGYHFVLSGPPYFYEPMAFAIRKGQTDLLALLNYAIKKMHHDGCLTKYAKTWYHGADPTQAPSADIPSYLELMATLGATP